MALFNGESGVVLVHVGVGIDLDYTARESNDVAAVAPQHAEEELE